MKHFIDSNIFIYAYSNDPKSLIAQNIITQGGIISVQVLNEVATVMRNKMHQPWEEIERTIQGIERMVTTVNPITHEHQKEAMALSRTHDLSIYDSLIIASAQAARCDRLISEDMQHMQRFGTLVIYNPFR